MTEPKSLREIIKANYLQPAFLICAAVLALTAGAMSAVIKISGAYLKKEPLPLKKPLSALDKFPLAPYTVAAKQTIDNPDVLETLGTEDYIQWVLEDTSVPQTDKTRYCSLFVTYYSAPDVVPHRPEECYIGGGFQQVSSDEVTLKIKSLSPQANGERQIGARYLVFARTSPDLLTGDTTFSVLYIFSVNGEYSGGRDQTRRILNKNLFGKFSYFSKVEWKFYGNNFGRMIYPDKQEAVAASEKLMKVILPVLEQQCWPSGLW
jgi:hypothetical protein